MRNNKVRRTVLLPRWVSENLKKIATQNGMSVNGLVNQACLNLIESYQTKEDLINELSGGSNDETKSNATHH